MISREELGPVTHARTADDVERAAIARAHESSVYRELAVTAEEEMRRRGDPPAFDEDGEAIGPARVGPAEKLFCTPTPWRQKPELGVNEIHGAYRTIWTSEEGDFAYFVGPHQVANSRLFFSAPNLAAALQDLADAVGRLELIGVHSELLPSTRHKVLLAWSQARGVLAGLIS